MQNLILNSEVPPAKYNLKKQFYIKFLFFLLYQKHTELWLQNQGAYQTVSFVYRSTLNPSMKRNTKTSWNSTQGILLWTKCWKRENSEVMVMLSISLLSNKVKIIKTVLISTQLSLYVMVIRSNCIKEECICLKYVHYFVVFRTTFLKRQDYYQLEVTYITKSWLTGKKTQFVSAH